MQTGTGISILLVETFGSSCFLFREMKKALKKALALAHVLPVADVLISSECLRYSMGGFGAFQLGCFAPESFDAIVSVAGYGLGTSEQDSGYGAPQPASSAWEI